MALGEACGIAATQAKKESVTVRKAAVPDIQREILKRGGVILFEGCPIRPEGL